MICEIKLNKRLTGENIRLYIQKSNYTYEDVAVYLSLATPRVIYEWVNGNKFPTIEKLIKLAILFEVLLEDILVVEGIF